MNGLPQESTRSHKRGKLRSETRYESGFRRQVVEAYLSGSDDQRKVAAHYGISQTSLCLWIKSYLAAKANGMEPFQTNKAPEKEFEQHTVSLQAELSRLKKELEEEKLRSLALEELIEVAEVRFKIPIRKKPGARQ